MAVASAHITNAAMLLLLTDSSVLYGMIHDTMWMMR